MVGDRVRHVGVEPSILLGCTQGDSTSVAQTLAAFSGSGTAVDRSPDIILALREKFLIAASLGGVAAALGLAEGRVATHNQGVLLLRAALEEVEALAAHIGISLIQDYFDATLAFAATLPRDATTSLQRDLVEGRDSKRDALTTAFCWIASAQGLRACTKQLY